VCGFHSVNSPDCDLLAQQDDRLLRIQVKTSTLFRKGRWSVSICTRGGNQSWNGIVKRLEHTRYDYLFVVVANWTFWFIPSSEVDARTGINLGGPKYAGFQVDPPQPISVRADASKLVMGEAGFEPA
jgi:hypothetical protein